MTKHAQKRYLDFLICPSHQRVNRIFLLLFETEAGRIGFTVYYLPTAELKVYNVIIDGRNLLINLLKMK